MPDARKANHIREAWELQPKNMEMLVDASAKPLPMCHVCGRTILIGKVNGGQVKIVYIGGARTFAIACSSHEANGDRWLAVDIV